MDWSLLGCGRSGHVTFEPDEPGLREQLCARTASGEAWRCLRCAAFVPGPPDGHGPAADAPSVRRGKEVRSALILRIFAVERFVRVLVFLALAYGLWRFRSARESISAAFNRELPILRELFSQLGWQIDHSKLVGLVEHALTLSNHAITLLALGLAAYAAVEVIEGVGLWLGRRWGEYFAMVATSLGLPLEIYDLTKKVTALTLILFAINLALVLYLVLAKRLFGVRGGKRAYEARLRSESVLEAAAEAAAATEAAGTPEAPGTAAAGTAAGGTAAGGTDGAGTAEGHTGGGGTSGAGTAGAGGSPIASGPETTDTARTASVTGTVAGAAETDPDRAHMGGGTAASREAAGGETETSDPPGHTPVAGGQARRSGQPS
jgi:uncharacterized membrane protein (DUF2068 family)